MAIGARLGHVSVSIAMSGLALGQLAAARADECIDAKTQAELTGCAGKAFDAADLALNATYKDVTGRLKGEEERRKLLVSAQKAWLLYRDGECDFESSPTLGGSIHSMIVLQCRTTHTVARTKALRAMLTCEEGDLSCPLPPK